MAKRIPHQEESIAGSDSASAYVDRHEKHAASQFGAFLNAFDKLDIEGRFLEIGSGPGFLTAQIAMRRPQSHITAIEPSPDMVDISRRYLDENGVGEYVDIVQGAVDDRDVMEGLGHFDLVYSTFSLHHWQKPQTAWRHMMSCVKREGTLLIHDLKRVAWMYYLPFNNGLFESIRAAYQPREIEHMLENMGVRNFKIKTPFPFFWMSILVHNNPAW